MAATLVKTAMLKIVTDDGDSEVKMDRIKAKAEELGRLHPELKVKIDKAAAVAQMGVLRNELKAQGRGMAQDAGQAGDNAGRGFFTRFGSWLKPSKFQLIVSGVAAGLAALPAVMAVAGVLGAAALGGALLVGTQKSQGPLYAQFHGMVSQIEGILKSAVAPLEKPMSQALSRIGQLFTAIGPELKQVFGAVGPLLGPLVSGLRGLVMGILPGFVDLLHAAAPAIVVFSRLLGSLGSDLGHMLATMAPAIHASAGILLVLGTILNSLFGVVGKLAGSLARALVPVLMSFAQAIHALAPALTVVGVVLGKLAGAVLGSLAGALQAVAHLAMAAAPAFGVLASVLGRVFSLMENAGVFGVLEDSLEKLAGPLGQLVGKLVSGLAPILPVILGAASKVASMLVGSLTHAVLGLLPSLTQMVEQFARMLVSLAPLAGPMVQLTAAQVQLLMALMPLIPPLTQIITLLARLAADAMPTVVSAIIPVITTGTRFLGTVTEIVAWLVKVVSAVLNFGSNLHDLGMVANVTASILEGAWGRVVSTTSAMIGDVVSFFTGLPGKIVSALGDLGSLLYSAGSAIVQGLISGIESAASGVLSVVEGLASKVTGIFSKVMGIFSPSKVFQRLGTLIVAGLALGLGTSKAATDEAKKLAADVVAAFKAGKLSAGQESSITAFIEHDNARLKTLAGQRTALLKTIAAARQYAQQITANALSFAGLANIQPKKGRITGQEIERGEQADLERIERFNKALERLGHLGLNKDSLDQIFQMGPDQGLPYALALLNGPHGRIGALNKTEKRIIAASNSLGHIAGNSLFESGKMAGKGFLDGLESHVKAITRIMQKIAHVMVSTLKKDLGISSPSRVGHWHGLMWAQGIAEGILAGPPIVAGAASRLARSAMVGPHGGLAAAGGGYGPQRVIVEFDVRGADAEIVTVLKKIVRVRGGDPTVFGR